MLLYHYTDQNGFMGIIQNHELWATKIQYLNDSSEFLLAIDLAKNHLQRLLPTQTDSKVTFRINRFISNLQNIINLNLCVCSLSEEGDLLSQWRGYSKQQGGYCIGFDKDELENLLSSQGYILKQCIYEQLEQNELIKSVISSSLELFSNYDEPDINHVSMSSRSSKYFTKELSKIAPLIKNKSFSEEQEWRIMSNGGINYNSLSFRTGTSMLIPFNKIFLRKDFWNLIKLVTVGHTPHSELAKSSTMAFLYQQQDAALKIMPQSNETPDVPSVINSKIPYRSW
jgi:hypothetical protein